VATGLFSYAVQLDDEQAGFFRNKPMVSHSGKGQSFFYRLLHCIPLAKMSIYPQPSFFLQPKAQWGKSHGYILSQTGKTLRYHMSRIFPRVLLRSAICARQSNGPESLYPPSEEHASPLSHPFGE
jgi:hypothetical protein